MTDSHTHLQKYPPQMLPEVLRRARVAGIVEFGCCGTSPADWERVAEIASTEDGVSPSFGIHPWEANAAAFEKLESFLSRFPSAAIGEIGLDSARPDPKRQAEIFIAQLRIARAYERGVTLHCVRAAGEMISLLKQHARSLPSILLHAPNISLQEWRDFERLGASVSIGARVLLPNATKTRELARIVPEDRLFFETDSPADASRLCGIAQLAGLNAPENLPRIVAAVRALR